MDEEKNTSNYTILVVEDDKINMKLAQLLLKNQGFNVLGAISDITCFGQLYNNNIDLILMDILLDGDLDGCEITKMIKSDNDYKHIPVIALTACTMQGDKEKCLEAGCDYYLSKPMHYKDIINKIKEALNIGDTNGKESIMV